MVWIMRVLSAVVTLEILANVFGIGIVLTPVHQDVKRTILTIVFVLTALWNLMELVGGFLPMVPFGTERKRKLAIAGATAGVVLSVMTLSVMWFPLGLGFYGVMGTVLFILLVALIADVLSAVYILR